jgi:hypothetical protein
MYTVKPGTLPQVLEASGTVARRIRGGDDYGKLEGHWSSEIGLLNQYVHLWAYRDIAEMTRLRSELAAIEAWRTEFLPLMRPHILSQRIRILQPVLDMKTPESDGNIYELRIYRLIPGVAAEWTGRMAEMMPVREKYSMNVGLWKTQLPDPNEVVHLWVYASFEERLAARTGMQSDPEWKEFLAYAGPLVEEMHSTLLLPSPYSPRK